MIAEPRQRPRPISFAEVTARRLLRHQLAPTHQAGTLPATNNAPCQFVKLFHGALEPYSLLEERPKINH